MDSTLKSTPISSTYFNWDEVNNFNGYDMPWLGSNSFLPANLMNDHKKEDGWELLFSNLDQSTYTVQRYFGLYNKYLGILRVFYLNTENDHSAQKFCMALMVNGNTKMLNFEQTVNMTFHNSLNILTSFQNPSVIKTSPVIISNSITPTNGYCKSAWYGMEYDLMYEDISNTDDVYLRFFPFAINIEELTFTTNTSGSIDGSITGTISVVPSGNSSTFGGVDLDLSNSATRVDNTNNNISGA